MRTKWRYINAKCAPPPNKAGCDGGIRLGSAPYQSNNRDIVAHINKSRLFLARDFARTLHLKSAKEWKKYARGYMSDKPERPKDIPIVADIAYRGKGWISWQDFLGIE